MQTTDVIEVIGLVSISFTVYFAIGAFIGGWVGVKHNDKDATYFITPLWPLLLPFLGIGAMCKRGIRYWTRREKAKAKRKIPKAQVVKR